MLRRAACRSSDFPQPVGHRFDRLASNTEGGIFGKILGPPISKLSWPDTASILSRTTSASRRLGFQRERKTLSGSAPDPRSLPIADLWNALDLASSPCICLILQPDWMNSVAR